jgi:hypothetical protein
MASPKAEYQILPEQLHSPALEISLNSLNRELAGQSTNDPEFIVGQLHSLHCCTACTSSAMKNGQTTSISTFADGG